MIRVAKHARGLAIGATEGADRNVLVGRVEQLLSERAFVSGGRLIAPLESAAQVLDILGDTTTEWDEDVLRHARRQRTERSMQLRAKLEVAEALDDPLRTIGDYPRLAALDRHQVQAVAALTAPSVRGIALFDEQGTGKTICALAGFDILRSRQCVRRLLVIAPKSVLGSWKEQAHRFLNNDLNVALVAGPRATRRRLILAPHDILLVGYETAVQDEDLLRTVVGAQMSTYALVVDESYFVKNPDTERSGAVARLRALCERAIVLCGTPAPNFAVDIVNQIDIADQGVAFAGRSMPTDPDAAATHIAEGLQHAIFLRRLKDDVLPDLARKQTTKIYLELSGAQKLLYEQTRNELVVAVRSVDDRQFRRQLTSFLAKRLRLLQICSNPRAIDPLYDETPTKLQALDRLLSELVEEQNRKVVIWSYFRASLESIAERYQKYGLVRIDGSISSIDARISAVERFQTDDNIRLFLGNAAAAGAGITLTAAHHAVYESFSNQAAHYMQSVDRIHRRGQVEQVTTHILITRDTVEEAEYARLVTKERHGRQLLGDQLREEITRERFLSELTS